MDEYISKEAAVRYLKGFSEKELNWNRNFGMITSSVLDKAERAISEMPAADVQPVKHGRWILCDDGYVRCSECNRKAFIENDETILTDFCHGCGADMIMDGGSDE